MYAPTAGAYPTGEFKTMQVIMAICDKESNAIVDWEEQLDWTNEQLEEAMREWNVDIVTPFLTLLRDEVTQRVEGIVNLSDPVPMAELIAFTAMTTE